MIRNATRDDLPLIRRLLLRANDYPYDVQAVAEEKCFGRGASGEPRVRLHGQAGVAVTCGQYLRLLAVDREQRGRGIGTALLGDSNASVIAAEAGNYFTPGVLEKDAGFFKKHRYEERASTWNLEAPVIARVTVPNEDVPNVAASDPRFLAFVEREFGRIWAFEASRARSAIYIENIGFAVIEANNRGLGTFGPTGVAKRHRGKGYGRTLLLAALAELGNLGYRHATIPWTDAIDFYRKSCGAEPAHSFVTLARR